MSAQFVLSAFGDEVDDDLARQLDVLATCGIWHLELRSAWGRNVLDLDEADLARVANLLRVRGFGVSAIGSPIGKSSLDLPRSYEQHRLDQAIRAARALGTRLIRVFSFFIAPHELEEHRAEVIERMRLLTAQATSEGMLLLHENERGIYGETPEHCRDLLAAVNSPALRQAFDPANFVQANVAPMREAWPRLREYVTHVHIKDAHVVDGSVCPAGQGDGEVAALLQALAQDEYHGFLTLEPHLVAAGTAGGYSGPEGMRAASDALRSLLATLRVPIDINPPL